MAAEYMMRCLIGASVFAVAVHFCVDARADPAIATEAPNWCVFAKQFLIQRDGSAFDCASAGRCIKLNNYGCTQNHTNVAIPGELKTPDGKPVKDPQSTSSSSTRNSPCIGLSTRYCAIMTKVCGRRLRSPKRGAVVRYPRQQGEER